MSADEPTPPKALWSIKELEPILDKLSGALERGEYGDGANGDRVQKCLDEGRRYIAESRKVTARIMVLEERADRLFEEFGRLAEELEDQS